MDSYGTPRGSADFPSATRQLAYLRAVPTGLPRGVQPRHSLHHHRSPAYVRFLDSSTSHRRRCHDAGVARLDPVLYCQWGSHLVIYWVWRGRTTTPRPWLEAQADTTWCHYSCSGIDRGAGVRGKGSVRGCCIACHPGKFNRR